MIQRGRPPHEGACALPGGHVNASETSLAASAREAGGGNRRHRRRPAPDRRLGRPDRDPRMPFLVAHCVDRTVRGPAALRPPHPGGQAPP
ncbi:hypothetical protein ACSR0Z_22540 (plasmid) [Streptomyces viridosporus]